MVLKKKNCNGHVPVEKFVMESASSSKDALENVVVVVLVTRFFIPTLV